MEKKAKPRAKFYVERDSALAHAAVIFMALSAVFRLVGCWGLWRDEFYAATQIALPLACNLLFILCLLLLGARAFWMTALPVILGVVFFIIKSFSFTSWLHTLLCILLYLLVAVLYTATAFGVVRTKWPLVPLFGLPFLYHIAIEDAAALRDTAHPVTLAAGLQELSVLCAMLALLLTALAMKKRKSAEEPALPKIKDPKVIVKNPLVKKQALPSPTAADAAQPAADVLPGSAEGAATEAQAAAETAETAPVQSGESTQQGTQPADAGVTL